ncbi:MAG: hypothetical protein ACR2KZ_14565 [Segetibacter sp.]
MQLDHFLIRAGAGTALEKSWLLPVRIQENQYPLACNNCRFINPTEYHFCTNCGYPVHPNPDSIALYNGRLQKRKRLQKICTVRVEYARNALYVISAFSMLGIFYMFSPVRQKEMTGFVMVVLGIIYAALGRWSLQKPFTALLISLIFMLTFTAINTWAEVSSRFSTIGSIYILIIQIILIHFLLQGVKGAFHADVLEEEFKL